MKLFWEESDITPGRRVRKLGTSEVWVIGYRTTLSEGVALVSLSDGLMGVPKPPFELALELTNQGYWPVEFL